MRKIGFAVLAINGLAVAGCAGGNVIDQAVPQAAFGNTAPSSSPDAASMEAGVAVPAAKPLDAPVAEAGSAYADSSPGTGHALNTGTYPNINREPVGTIGVMTDEQRDVLMAQMEQLAQAHSQGLVSTEEYNRRLAELRRLAATHSEDTIKIIEE